MSAPASQEDEDETYPRAPDESYKDKEMPKLSLADFAELAAEQPAVNVESSPTNTSQSLQVAPVEHEPHEADEGKEPNLPQTESEELKIEHMDTSDSYSSKNPVSQDVHTIDKVCVTAIQTLVDMCKQEMLPSPDSTVESPVVSKITSDIDSSAPEKKEVLAVKIEEGSSPMKDSGIGEGAIDSLPPPSKFPTDAPVNGPEAKPQSLSSAKPSSTHKHDKHSSSTHRHEHRHDERRKSSRDDRSHKSRHSHSHKDRDSRRSHSRSRRHSSSSHSSSRHSKHSSSCRSRVGRSCDCSHSRPVKSYNIRVQVNEADLLTQGRKDWVPPLKPRIPWQPHHLTDHLKYAKYVRVEVDRNGGANICHLYWDEICHLKKEKIDEICLEFIKLSYSEDENCNAYFVIGIVHGAGEYLPDLIDYMADHYGHITVQVGSLTGRGTQTLTMGQYRDEVYKSYSNGTYRYAPLQEISICGVQREEVGAYFPDFVERLEQSPTIKPVMPWSFLSVVSTKNPRESNDGPIFWVRPGEQTLPSSDRSTGRMNKGVSRMGEEREALFEDRTKPHSDQIGIDVGLSSSAPTAPTAAVGVLKAVLCRHREHGFRATKDVIAFDARDYNLLLNILRIDVFEPPLNQCPIFIETAKLNSLKRAGIRFAHVQLHDNDVYYLPRKIIHQFQTISAVASVAWHVRLNTYFEATGAPNLHIPTGLNKGAVYHEKKVVVPYEAPTPDVDQMAAIDEIVVKTPKKLGAAKKRSRSMSKAEGPHKGEVTPQKNDPSSSYTPKEKKAKESKGVVTPIKLTLKSTSDGGKNKYPDYQVVAYKQSNATTVAQNGDKDHHENSSVQASEPAATPITPPTSKPTADPTLASEPTALTATQLESSKVPQGVKSMKKNVTPAKKRKVSATSVKKEAYDVVGDIMAQMAKSKTDL